MKTMSASLRFAPMSLAVLDEPFDHDDFIFELKYDGFRALANVDGGRCRLISQPPRIHDVPRTLHRDRSSPAWPVSAGRRDRLFGQGWRDLMRRRAPQYFYAFDPLWADGQDLRGLPLIKRKRLLKKIVKSPVLFADHLAGRGVDLFRAVCQRDLEGIVAKAARGLYRPENNLG